MVCLPFQPAERVLFVFMIIANPPHFSDLLQVVVEKKLQPIEKVMPFIVDILVINRELTVIRVNGVQIDQNRILLYGDPSCSDDFSLFV